MSHYIIVCNKSVLLPSHTPPAPPSPADPPIPTHNFTLDFLQTPSLLGKYQYNKSRFLLGCFLYFFRHFKQGSEVLFYICLFVSKKLTLCVLQQDWIRMFLGKIGSMCLTTRLNLHDWIGVFCKKIDSRCSKAKNESVHCSVFHNKMKSMGCLQDLLNVFYNKIESAFWKQDWLGVFWNKIKSVYSKARLARCVLQQDWIHVFYGKIAMCLATSLNPCVLCKIGSVCSENRWLVHP